MPKLKIKPSFQKKFLTFPIPDQLRIIEKLGFFEQNYKNMDIKKLHPEQLRLYRLRIGKYRIIFEYETPEIVTLLAIDSRDKIYKQ